MQLQSTPKTKTESKFLQKLSFRFHNCRLVSSAARAEPLPLGFTGELDAGEVEPLDGTQVVVAADHLAVGDLVAQAVGRLVRVDVHVAEVGRAHAAVPRVPRLAALASLLPSSLARP